MQLKYLFSAILIAMVLLPTEAICGGLHTKGEKIEKAEIKLDSDVAIKNIAKQHKSRTDWSKEIDLSKEQKMLVQQIYERNQPQLDELVSQIKALQQKVKEIHHTEDLEIRGILDEQQQIKFDKYMWQNKKKDGGKTEGKKPSRKRMRKY
ncbi:MAG: hypothetical protein IJ525_06500 [Alphaproteobacteria bacterium]|nr:hypothetical protein [Alphaproteobacteria bacterium]